MKIILWVVFVSLILFMGHENQVVTNGSKTTSLFRLEFADSAQGKAMLTTWKAKHYGDGTILDLATSNTHTDFLFVITYTLLLLVYSNDQMQHERTLWLNTLLRFNLLLAVLAGLLDTTENFILLFDMRHVADPDIYIPSYWVSMLKWILAGLAVFVWLVSIIHTGITHKEKEGYHSLTDTTNG